MKHTAAFALPAALCLGLAAQQPGLRAPAATGLATAQGVFVCDGELVALGANYKAWFCDGEVEFVPAFGRTAKHNVPLRLRATGMARGEAAVAFASVPAQRHGAEAVRFARAVGVAEIFVAQERGLEQSFVFAERPAGNGDLVVTCALQCECDSAADGQGGLVFAAPGVGTFTIGAVTGIDAAGERVRGALQRTGNTLTMSLPADFVDRATYPLVLDPLLGGPVLASGLDRENADVVFDAGTGDWLAVWQTFDSSSSDADIYGQRIDQATGSAFGGVFPIDVTSVNTLNPRAGSVRSAGRVLVVYHWAGIFTGALQCRTIAVAAGTASTAATLASTGWSRYAVASEDTTADNEALVVWGTGTDVVAMQVTVNASGAPLVSVAISIVSGLTDPTCSISKTNGGSGNYLIAWRSAGILPVGGTTLYAILVSRNLAVLTPSHTVDTAVSGAAAIDCNGSRYLVAYTRWESGGMTRDIRCASVVYLAAFGALTVIDGPTPLEATVGQDETWPDVAWLGQRYCVTFTENTGTTTENAFAWLVSPDCTTCNTRMTLAGVNLTTSYTLERDARVAGRAHFVAGAIDGEIVYTEDQTTPPHPIVVGQRVVSSGPGGAVTNLGGGCGQGGTATSTANGFAVGNTNCQFAVTGLAPGALPLCCLAVPAATIPCGTCTFLNPLATYFEPNVAGTATFTFAVPCGTVFIGFQMDVQWASLLTPTSPCPLVSGLSASNRVRFTVGS
ncbi:MAG: hypothetical protein WBO45_21440 [Planctomycetota bacterium]